MTKSYAKSYTEILEILSHFSEEEYNKIPKEKIEFYEKNKDTEYEFSINPSIDLKKQNISKETNAIIITLFRDYFATEKQKQVLKKILENNEINAEEEKKKIYSVDNIFKKTEIEKNENVETALIERKEPILNKILDFIKKLFKKR